MKPTRFLSAVEKRVALASAVLATANVMAVLAFLIDAAALGASA